MAEANSEFWDVAIWLMLLVSLGLIFYLFTRR